MDDTLWDWFDVKLIKYVGGEVHIETNIFTRDYPEIGLVFFIFINSV